MADLEKKLKLIKGHEGRESAMVHSHQSGMFGFILAVILKNMRAAGGAVLCGVTHR